MSLNDLLEDLRKDYVQELSDKIQSARLDLESSNLRSLQVFFHKIKGSGKTYGVPEVSTLGEVLESICKSMTPDFTNLEQGIAILERIYQKRSVDNQEYTLENDPDFSELRSRACY